jgi:hypothetical protein
MREGAVDHAGVAVTNELTLRQPCIEAREHGSHRLVQGLCRQDGEAAGLIRSLGLRRSMVYTQKRMQQAVTNKPN